MRGLTMLTGGMDRPGCGFLSSGELERFLDDRLSAERAAAFSGHRGDGCADCALLAADALAFRGVLEGGVLECERREFEQDRAILAAQLRQRLEALDAHRGRSKFMRWAPALGAVAAMLVLAVTVAPRLPLRGDTDGRIRLEDGRVVALTPFEYVEPVVVRGAAVRAELWAEAGAAYRAGRYADAVAPLAALAAGEPDSIDANLYLGNALLMCERFAQARTALERAETLAGRGTAATFGLAQVALAAGDPAAARSALEAVIERDGPLGDSARELLGTLTH